MGGGPPSGRLWGRAMSIWLTGGYLHLADRTGWGTPLSGLDGDTPHPHQNWMGVAPTLQLLGDRPAERGLAKRRAVCLMYSRRKTFL